MQRAAEDKNIIAIVLCKCKVCISLLSVASYTVCVDISERARRAAEDKNNIAIVLCSCISFLSIL